MNWDVGWGCIWREVEMNVSRLRRDRGLDGVGVGVRECGGPFVARVYVSKYRNDWGLYGLYTGLWLGMVQV